MAAPLSPEQFQRLQHEIETGEASLDFPRSFARRFYTHVSAGNIRRTTGQSAIVQQLTVISLLGASLLLLFACMVTFYLAFGTTGLFAAPVIGIFWTIIAGFTSDAGSTRSTNLIAMLVLVACWWLPRDYGPTMAILTLSVYSYRLAHIVAHYFLSRLIASSYEAYEMLFEQIDVSRES